MNKTLFDGRDLVCVGEDPVWAEGAQLVRCVAALLIAALQGWGPAAIRQRVVGSAKDVNEGGGGEQREGAGKKKRGRGLGRREG